MAGRTILLAIGAAAVLAESPTVASAARQHEQRAVWNDLDTTPDFALGDRALDQVRGGQRFMVLSRYEDNVETISRAQNRYEFGALAGIAREQMDVWWASDGIDLIAPNLGE